MVVARCRGLQHPVSQTVMLPNRGVLPGARSFHGPRVGCIQDNRRLRTGPKFCDPFRVSTNQYALFMPEIQTKLSRLSTQAPATHHPELQGCFELIGCKQAQVTIQSVQSRPEQNEERQSQDHGTSQADVNCIQCTGLLLHIDRVGLFDPGGIVGIFGSAQVNGCAGVTGYLR